MAQWALQFTPSVTVEAHRDVLLMEVKASLRLWGGFHALGKKLSRGWRLLGWQGEDAIVMAHAPTAKAAHWQAFADAQTVASLNDSDLIRPADLHGLPIETIEEASRHVQTLHRMGVRTIGQLWRLPRGGLARRFGAPLLNALDAARGEHPDPRPWIRADEQFERRLELPARADHWALVMYASSRLFCELSAWLGARQAGITQCLIQLIHDEPPPTDIRLGFAQATRDCGRFERIFSEQVSPRRLNQPVYEIRLCAGQIEPLCHLSSDWLYSKTPAADGINAVDPDGMPELIERLQARLGPSNVQQLILQDDHRPEQAMAVKPVGRISVKRPLKIIRDTAQSHRPTWLLGSPLALAVDGPRPLYRDVPLRLLCGPERIESGWWEDTPQAIAQRDYFIAASAEHELVWIYRTPDHRWYLHGFFS